MKLPQLSLRDLFWLVLVAAMGCGWWVSYRGWNERWRNDVTNLLDMCDTQSQQLRSRERFLRELGYESTTADGDFLPEPRLIQP